MGVSSVSDTQDHTWPPLADHLTRYLLQSKAKEEAAKKAEAEAAKADAKTIGDRVVSLFDLPLLSLLKDPLEPVLDIVADSAVAASAFAVLLLALPLSILYLLVPKVSFSTEIKIARNNEGQNVFLQIPLLQHLCAQHELCSSKRIDPRNGLCWSGPPLIAISD